jgi:hypothetical protein
MLKNKTKSLIFLGAILAARSLMAEPANVDLNPEPAQVPVEISSAEPIAAPVKKPALKAAVGIKNSRPNYKTMIAIAAATGATLLVGVPLAVATAGKWKHNDWLHYIPDCFRSSASGAPGGSTGRPRAPAGVSRVRPPLAPPLAPAAPRARGGAGHVRRAAAPGARGSLHFSSAQGYIKNPKNFANISPAMHEYLEAKEEVGAPEYLRCRQSGCRNAVEDMFSPGQPFFLCRACRLATGCHACIL